MAPLRFVETSAAAIRYAQAGQGVDVVLVHGAMTTVEDMLLGPFDALAERWRVTAFDRPGHGRTTRPRLQGGPGRQARQLLEAMDALGLGPAVIVGQSFGAAVAMDLALQAPERVLGVLAISPIVYPELRMEHLLYGPRAVPGFGEMIGYGPGRILDAMLLPPLWHAMFAPQAMPARYAQAYPFALASGPSQMIALGEEAMLALPDLAVASRRYPECVRPVAILQGLEDWLALPFVHAGRLAGAVPDAELSLLPGLGHMLHHFAVPQVVQAVGGLAARAA